jgi:competence protein ComEA
MLKKEFKTILVLTRGERNGIIGLIILLFILIIIRFLMPIFNKKAEEKELQIFEKVKKEYFAKLHESDSTSNNYIQHDKSTKKIANRNNIPKNKVRVEINKADTSELDKLPGIGKILSKRIIKYRQLLGGFYSKEQLGEVYGINDLLKKNIIPYVFIDTSLIHKLSINTDDFKKINAHPYISYEQTKGIFNLRYRTKGKIEIEILKKSGIFDSVTLQKIKPYLKFD